MLKVNSIIEKCQLKKNNYIVFLAVVVPPVIILGVV